MGRYRPPQPKGSPYITAEGYAKLDAELKALWKRRAIVVKILAEAAAEGDRSENAEYIYRKKELREIDYRIRYLQKRLPDLKVVATQPSNPQQVFFAAWVTLEDDHGEEKTYRIVGPDEFDAKKGWISMDSPVAKALDLQCPTEIGIGDRLEAELGKCGILPLVHHKNADHAVFIGGESAQKAKQYQGKGGKAASENAQISARLPYIMASSRFAHYLKSIARDWIGSFKEADDLQSSLEDWIGNYVSEAAKGDDRARFPLREAKIEVKAVEGKSGAYNAIAYLRPWLQMEELTTSLRMVARIPGKGG